MSNKATAKHPLKGLNIGAKESWRKQHGPYCLQACLLIPLMIYFRTVAWRIYHLWPLQSFFARNTVYHYAGVLSPTSQSAPAVSLNQPHLHSHSPPQRFSPFSFAGIWSESGIGASFAFLSVSLSCAIGSFSVIYRPLTSPRRLEDLFVLYLVFLASVSSLLSCHPFLGFVVATVVYEPARRGTYRDVNSIQAFFFIFCFHSLKYDLPLFFTTKVAKSQRY